MGLISFLFGKKKDDDELVKKQKQVNESTSSAEPTEQELHDQDDQSIIDNIVAEEESESLRTAAQEDNESVFGDQKSEDDANSIADQVEAAEKKEQPCDSNKQGKELNPQAPHATKGNSSEIAPTVASEDKAKLEIPLPSARHLDLTHDSPFRDGTLPPIPENEVYNEPASNIESIVSVAPKTVKAEELVSASKVEPSASLGMDVKSELEAEVKPEVKVEAKIKPEPKAEPEVEVKPEVKVEAKIKPEPKVEPEVEVKPEVKVEAKIKPEPKAEPEVEVKPEVKVEAKIKPEPKAESEVEVKPEAKDEARVKTELKVEPNVEVKPEKELLEEDKNEVVEESEDDSQLKFKSKFAKVREEETKEEVPDIGPAPAPVNVSVTVRTQPSSPFDSWSRVDNSLETTTAKSQINQTDGAEYSVDEVLDGRSLGSQTVKPSKSTKQIKHSENQIEDTSKAATAFATKVDTAVVTAVVTQEAKVEENKSLFSRLKRTRDTFTKSMSNLIRGRMIDDDLFDDLETDLLMADVGGDTTYRLIDRLREESNLRDLSDAVALRKSLKSFLVEILKPCEQPLVVTGKKPYVILMVGVNGAGKTTTIGKLARKYQDLGLSVMLAAGDTFRAAAVEQLKEWGARTNVPVIAQSTGSDSASVLYDAVNSATKHKVDVLICDTAGRLQNKEGLMGELKKIVRVMKKLDPQVPHEVLLVLDGTTGQNAVSQVKNFSEAVNVTGLVLTKLDGTAKGGIVFSLADLFKIPIRYVGIGERVEDLREFKVEPFVDALIDDKDI